jgi:hypothetical protein
LYHFLASIDYVHERLILRARSDSGEFEKRAAARGASVVPMWLVGDHCIFAIARADSAPAGLFNIDTGEGAFGVQLTQPTLDQAGIVLDQTNNAGTFSGGGGIARTVSFDAAAVELGSYTAQNLPGAYFPNGDQYDNFPFSVVGTLAQPFFRDRVVTFDFDTMQLTIAKG